MRPIFPISRNVSNHYSEKREKKMGFCNIWIFVTIVSIFLPVVVMVELNDATNDCPDPILTIYGIFMITPIVLVTHGSCHSHLVCTFPLCAN